MLPQGMLLGRRGKFLHFLRWLLGPDRFVLILRDVSTHYVATIDSLGKPLLGRDQLEASRLANCFGLSDVFILSQEECSNRPICTIVVQVMLAWSLI